MMMKIKFNQKINLLNVGSGAAKDWVLLAQVLETSFLRNFMGLRMGQLLEGIDYSSGFKLVEVYQNSEYMGVYQLCEQVEAIAEEGRAAIEANFEKWQISGSYDDVYNSLMRWHSLRKAWLDENFARYLPDGYEIGKKIGIISR